MSNTSFYFIKSFDIFYITFIYIFIAFIPAIYIDKLFSKLTNNNIEKSKNQLLTEIVIQISFTGVISYILRNLVMLIPSPFHGIDNFDHYKVKELNSGAVMFVFLLNFQKSLQNKITKIRNLL